MESWGPFFVAIDPLALVSTLSLFFLFLLSFFFIFLCHFLLSPGMSICLPWQALPSGVDSWNLFQRPSSVAVKAQEQIRILLTYLLSTPSHPPNLFIKKKHEVTSCRRRGPIFIHNRLPGWKRFSHTFEFRVSQTVFFYYYLEGLLDMRPWKFEEVLVKEITVFPLTTVIYIIYIFIY